MMRALARPRHKTRKARKALLTAAVLVSTAAVAGMGTFADFTSTTSASQTVSSGTVTIALGAAGANNRLTVNATGIVPGDTMQRAFNISNSGTQDLASATITTSATTSTVLDTDATNGLQMVIDECSVAWTEAGTTPAFTYTCSGTQNTRVTSRAVIQSGISLGSSTILTAGATGYYRLTLTLPTGAGTDNTFQNKSSTIQYSFTGTQRAGSAH